MADAFGSVTRRMSSILYRTAGVVDQGSIAGASFVSTVLMGRALNPDAFGVFALAFAVLLLAERLQHGMIGAPFLASSGPLGVSPGAVWALQWRLVAALGVLFLASGLVLSVIVDWPGVVEATLAVVPALLGIQARDLSRYFCYQRGQAVRAAGVGAISGVLQVGALGMLFLNGGLGVGTGILAIGGSAGAAFILSIPFARPPLRARGSTPDGRRSLWERGRWLSLSNLIFWGSTQMFLFTVAALIGPAQAGVFRAAQSVLGPTQLLVAGLFNALVPTAARRLTAGHSVLVSVRGSIAAIGVAVGAYCLVVIIVPDFLLTFLFGSQYGGNGSVVRVLAGGYLLSGLAGAMTLVLVVVHRTDLVLRAHIATLAVSVAVALPLTSRFGLVGAAVGLAAVFGCRFICLAWYAVKVASKDNA